jgi:hypothetical protein
MNNRDKQFLTLYQENRHKDQAGFYRARHTEFEKAHRQAIIMTGLLMFLASVASFLTTNPLFGETWMWAVLATVFPALSTALTAYNSIFAFEQQSKLYQDALSALHKAAANAYELQQATDEADYQSKLAAYVAQVEEILRREQGQWGQLISQLKPVEAPPKAEAAPPAETPPPTETEPAPDESQTPEAAESTEPAPDAPPASEAAETPDEPQTSEASETPEAGKPNEPAG